MLFIVTGTPRSATGYASLLLKAMDIRCSHERTFRPRTTLHEALTWYREVGDGGESSWLAWAFLGTLPSAITVLHTVRNPWAVIDSLAHRNDILPKAAELSRDKKVYRDMVRAYCPAVFDWDSDVNRAAQMVVTWNLLIESAAAQHGCDYHRYRVEDMSLALARQITEWIGVYREDAEIEAALAATPTNVNGGRQIDHNVEVKNPLVRAYLEEVMPGVEPVISRVLSTPQLRTREELEDEMDATLRNDVRLLAERYGYATTQELTNGKRQLQAV